jgi:uncharacterized repeat protein (TIGR03803 family)
MAKPVSGRKPVLPLLMRLLWAAAFVLPAFCAQAAVVLTSLHSFDSRDGINPYGGLVQGTDGNFYGETVFGGTNGYGTVFRLTILPEFQTVTLTNNTVSLSWYAEYGGLYQLQYVPDLSSSNWTDLGSPITATGATLNTTDSITNGPQRFYRLVLLP